MKIFFGQVGWGWKMYGVASLREGCTWFIGFSKAVKQEVKS